MLLALDFKKRNMTLLGLLLFGLFMTVFLYQTPLILTIFSILMIYVLTGDRPTIIYALFVTAPRDISAILKFARFNICLFRYNWRGMTVTRIFQEIVKRHPSKEAFIMDDKKLTFQDVDNFSNKIASYFISQKKFQRGDTVALLMETRPEYPCIWVGMAKAGQITALINSNLRKETLIHSIKIANSKAIILGSELVSAVSDIRNEEGIKDLPIYVYHDKKEEGFSKNLLDDAIDLTAELEAHTPIDIQDEILKANLKDKMVYIYTSGTTGMPKAAVITHLRYIFISLGSAFMLGIKHDDIIYNPLPLYHTAGGMIGVGNVLLHGLTMALRKKFSASNYWTDCIKYKCTVAQYIGELCRYLLSTQSKPTDTQHSIRIMFGNGLRPQIWQKFISRFNIPQIGEVYGSTEGNSNLVNVDNQIGAVGFIPMIASSFYPVALIKCEEDSGEPIRDSNGRCIKCEIGEPGIFIGKIDPKRALTSFSGYADKIASQKKILKDVFVDGDMYFNSGDILVKDLLGYFYFKDRTGDTFRWRGENVATSEVEAVISNGVGLQDCVVFGVEIPHVEGKAGMAAIVDPDRKLDIEQLSICIRGSLAPYARPLFVRLIPELPMTGTFKLKKRDLQQEGFDINKIKDPIYFLHSDGIYREFTQKDFDDVQNGRARL